MFFKKAVSSAVLCGLLLTQSCGVQEQTSSEVKVEPATVYAAVQTAVAIVQAIWERKNAVNQNDINQILNAINAAKQELMAHNDNRFVQEWIANVHGLELSFERYVSIRQDRGQLNALLLDIERSFAQVEAIFVNIPVYQSHKAALAFNSVAAMRMVALMDYSNDIQQIKAFNSRVMATNERLLSVPAFPAHTMNGPTMVIENCKVMTAPFLMDQRDHILYSGLAVWTMGYHPGGHEFRYYQNGQFKGSCWEDKNGNGASRLPMFRLNSWADIVNPMYNDNISAVQNNPLYRATQQSNDAIKQFQATIP